MVSVKGQLSLTCSCSTASRAGPLMRKSLEVLSFMYCMRFTCRRPKTSVHYPQPRPAMNSAALPGNYPRNHVFHSTFLLTQNVCSPMTGGHTFDFFERRMRNFSYCSILKIKLGIALDSRRTFACRRNSHLCSAGLSSTPHKDSLTTCWDSHCKWSNCKHIMHESTLGVTLK